MNDDLAARRAAVAARLERARQETLERVRQAKAVDGTAAAILASRKAHPSNHRRPYDQENDE